MMAQTLIHRAADKLQPFITKFLNDMLVEGKSSETDLSSRAYELIFELNFVNASLLLYVLPQLDQQLKVEDLETRSSAVQLLARMFAAKDSTLPSSYPHLFSAFLGRFKDVNHEIRIVMVQFAEHFIINQADDKLLHSVTGKQQIAPLISTFIRRY
jgi:sister-chromatid-cohesion protein PDS5